ncbi:homeobox domain-containing protein, partial [Dimargaris cristalligena]
KHRQRTTRKQFKALEEVFVLDPKPSASQRRELGERLNMSARSVQVWFQNRRAKEK